MRISLYNAVEPRGSRSTNQLHARIPTHTRLKRRPGIAKFDCAREIFVKRRAYSSAGPPFFCSRCLMTVFSVVLFFHLLGAVSLFIAYGIEWTASTLFRKSSSVEQVRSWLRVFKVSPPLSGIGLLRGVGFRRIFGFSYRGDEARLDSRSPNRHFLRVGHRFCSRSFHA